MDTRAMSKAKIEYSKLESSGSDQKKESILILHVVLQHAPPYRFNIRGVSIVASKSISRSHGPCSEGRSSGVARKRN